MCLFHYDSKKLCCLYVPQGIIALNLKKVQTEQYSPK